MDVGENLFKFAEEHRLRIGWHVTKVDQGRDELLACQCDQDLDMIADSMGVRLAPSSLSAFALRRVEATVVSASPEGLSTVIDALSAMTRKPSPGLEGYNDIASDPRFAAGMPPAPLSPDELVLPTLGDMRAGWFVADDEEGLNGDSRVAVCASVH